MMLLGRARGPGVTIRRIGIAKVFALSVALVRELKLRPKQKVVLWLDDRSPPRYLELRFKGRGLISGFTLSRDGNTGKGLMFRIVAHRVPWAPIGRAKYENRRGALRIMFPVARRTKR
jgi:hypothetical protein